MKEYHEFINRHSHATIMGKDGVARSYDNRDAIRIMKEFFKRYWLSDKEYESRWKPIKNSIYKLSSRLLPDKMFKDEFDIIVGKGGAIIIEDDLPKYRKIMKAMGEDDFVVIEELNQRGRSVPYKLKFPSDVTWSELMSGGYISQDLFQFGLGDHYIFGSSGNWGKYLSYEYSLELTGFKPKYGALFSEVFKASKDDMEDLKSWNPPIPEYYKKFLPKV